MTFGTLPTGIDNTALKGEYNYKNNESMMSLSREGVTRYFFFWNQRLWKTYDAVALKQQAELGSTYQEAVAALTKRFNVAGRVLAEDAEHGRNATEVDWADRATHVRAIDRSPEHLVGLVFEDRFTAERLATFKAQQTGDDSAIDPQISAITKGGPAVDSNAGAADAYTGKAHALPPGPAAPPKKK